jgi:hypothetical protein
MTGPLEVKLWSLSRRFERSAAFGEARAPLKDTGAPDCDRAGWDEEIAGADMYSKYEYPMQSY